MLPPLIESQRTILVFELLIIVFMGQSHSGPPKVQQVRDRAKVGSSQLKGNSNGGNGVCSYAPKKASGG